MFTDPIFNDGFGNDELAMEHQLVHMHYLTCAIHSTYPKRDLFWSTDTCTNTYDDLWSRPLRIHNAYRIHLHLRTHHHLFFMHDEEICLIVNDSDEGMGEA